jgi:hypothetical protein
VLLHKRHHLVHITGAVHVDDAQPELVGLLDDVMG